MNNQTLETTVETGKLPFPSHVKTAAPCQDVQPLARDIVDNSRDLNNVLQSAGNVHYFVRSHYVDVATGTYGIERLIAQILKDNRSEFPAGIESTEFRKVAIAGSMFVSDIIAKVQEVFGAERYPYGTIHSYLSYFMTKDGNANQVARIKLTNAEDCNRPCCKPRTKFYFVDKV